MMRIVSGIMFLLGAAAVYFGLGMLLFPPGKDWMMDVLVKGGLVAVGVLLLGGGGWVWYRAKSLDLRLRDPDNVPGWSSPQTRRKLVEHSMMFLAGGLFLVILVFVRMATQ